MKLIILCTDIEDGINVAKSLQEANDDMQIAPIFTTDLKMKGKVGEILYYMANEEVELGYRNNAFMWVRTSQTFTNGVTMPDMYSSSIFIMTYADFNNISNLVFNKLKNIDEEFLIVIIDETQSKKSDEDIREAHAAYERIDTSTYLYFLNEKTCDITECILKYFVANKEEREKIIDTLNN